MEKTSSLKRPCPICHNKTGDVLYTQKFVLPNNHILPNQYDIVVCCACGCVYADMNATQEIYDKYYARMSKYEMEYIDKNSTLYEDRAEWIKTVVENTAADIIDIGSGNAQLLLKLQKRGYANLTALDASRKCITAIQNNGITGIIGSIFDVSIGKRYDVIIMSGVLEHIYDVNKIMEISQSLAKENGLLLVCVPDASQYRDFDSIPFDYFNIEHINHFTETSLINLGYVHGFRIVSLLKTKIMISRVEQPMVFCAYRNEGRDATDWLHFSAKEISEYIIHTQKNKKANLIIDRLAESGEEIAVWGAGNYTSRLLATSDLSKCNIVMLVDNDKHKQGTNIMGIQVCPPDALLNMGNMPVILVAAAVFHDEILAEIKHMGIKNKVVVL